MDELLRFEHVDLQRGSTRVLNDISLTIRQGENLVILGPNGCGKSTLLKTMTCELYPLVSERTTVEILGRRRWDLTELKRRMGVVAAELPGRHMLSTNGLDAVVTGYFSSSTLWPNLHVTAEMRDAAEELLLLVGGASLRERTVGEMSAGQQRRVMIARALAGNRGAPSTPQDAGPRMLLLDEPSNALDIAAQEQLREMLSALAQAGTAILLITHHVADIIPEIDRVVMMRDGRIVADGGRADLLTSEKLSELFGLQVELASHRGRLHMM